MYITSIKIEQDYTCHNYNQINTSLTSGSHNTVGKTFTFICTVSSFGSRVGYLFKHVRNLRYLFSCSIWINISNNDDQGKCPYVRPC